MIMTGLPYMLSGPRRERWSAVTWANSASASPCPGRARAVPDDPNDADCASRVRTEMAMRSAMSKLWISAHRRCVRPAGVERTDSESSTLVAPGQPQHVLSDVIQDHLPRHRRRLDEP